MTKQATLCFHCHEVNPAHSTFYTLVDGEQQVFCCPGCLAVAETILEQGLQDYYKFRSQPATKADLVPAELSHFNQYDQPAILQELATHDGNYTQIELSVSGMSCAACAWLIEKQLQKLPAISQVNVNSGTARCSLRWQAELLPLSEILQQIAKLGYSASPFMADAEEATFQSEMRGYLQRLAVAGIMTMQVMMLAFGLYFGDYSGIEPQQQVYLRWVSLVLTIPVLVFAAKPFSYSAMRALMLRQLNMDVPITLALYYTFFASVYATISQAGEVYFESVCMFVFLLQLGKFFEFRARKQARDATSNLLKIMPVSAALWDGSSATIIAARHLTVDDIILVKAGETIPADGVILTGFSSVDESMLTGEYQPLAKSAGDTVLAGALNHDGVLTIQVSKGLDQSRLGQIIQLQQQTLHQKPRLLEKTDKLARFFVQRLLLIATATFLVWYLYIDPSRAFWVTLSVLVATCPCALSLATPTAITCALARLNRQGILIKNQQVLEFLPKLSRIFLDKTGTLTEGRFSLQHCTILDPNYHKSELLNLIANLEQQSEHPIGKAFQPYRLNDCELTDVTVHVGAGISANWHPNSEVSSANIQAPGVKLKLGSAQFCGVAGQTQSQVYICINDQLVAHLSLQDALRPEAPQLSQQLQQLGLKCSILTGDQSAHAQQVANQLAITELFQGCSPEQKVAQIQQAVQAGEHVLMIGDGINDSPCFHAAHVSVALDSGTDLSKNQADIVLLHNDLLGLIELIRSAKRARTIVRQNLSWALVYNLLIVPLAVCGLVSPYIAVIGMSCSSLLVVTNSLRLLKT